MTMTMRFSKKRRQPGIQQHQEKEGDNRNHIGDGKHVCRTSLQPAFYRCPKICQCVNRIREQVHDGCRKQDTSSKRITN